MTSKNIRGNEYLDWAWTSSMDNLLRVKIRRDIEDYVDLDALSEIQFSESLGISQEQVEMEVRTYRHTKSQYTLVFFFDIDFRIGTRIEFRYSRQTEYPFKLTDYNKAKIIEAVRDRTLKKRFMKELL